MNSIDKEKTMKPHQQSVVKLNNENNSDNLSFVKLHSILCFLMTQFHKDHSPHLAQYIVSHINLIIEHPDAVHFPDCSNLYLGLLQQWQNITSDILERRQTLAGEDQSFH
jgi:hypothetical protein